MKIIEKVLGGLTIVSMMCRLLFTYPFSALLITLSCLFLSLLYFLFGFALLNSISFRDILKKESYKDISALRILLAISTGFALSSLIIFILFKFQIWPFGNIGLRICLLWLLIIVAAVAIKYLNSKNRFYSHFLIRLFTVGIYGGLLYFIPSESLLEMKYKDFPNYVEAEKALMKDPENIHLLERANQERQKMHLSDN